MALSITVATLTIQSITPYSPSRKHDEPTLDGESHEDYNRRTWASQALFQNGTVHIPSAGFHQCLVAAAKYSKRQIPGQGKATWTAKFKSGTSLMDNINLGVKQEDTKEYIDIYANADGVRGSGKRVMRRFPIFNSWGSTFDVHILDPIIIKDVFEDMVEIAGMFIGLGRYRPEKGGTNGRFSLTNLAWKDGRELLRKHAA